MLAKGMEVHPSWALQQRDKLDVALVILPRPVRWSVPIMLPDEKHPYLPNTPVYGLGWGLHYDQDETGQWKHEVQDDLQEVRLKIVGNRVCPVRFKENLTAHTICAYHERQCPCKGELASHQIRCWCSGLKCICCPSMICPVSCQLFQRSADSRFPGCFWQVIPGGPYSFRMNRTGLSGTASLTGTFCLPSRHLAAPAAVSNTVPDSTRRSPTAFPGLMKSH